MGKPNDRPSPMRRAYIKGLGFIFDLINSLAKPWLPEFNGAEISQLFVQIPNLDPVFDGYRLVQISDIHLGTTVQEDHLNAIVDLVNQLEPDTIAITGDFVSHQPEEFAIPLLKALRRLRAKDVKVAVLGNHDHWTSAESIRWVLKRSLFVELRNSVLALNREQKLLFLAGVDDFLVNLDQIGKILDLIPEDKAAILLAHEPDFADISAATGRFGLQISGHTHGGQIQIPLVSRLLLPPRGRKYPSGQYRINGMTLYTNRGIGTSWLKFRFRCPPEITVYNLRAD